MDLGLHILAGWIAAQFTHDIGIKLILSWLAGEGLKKAAEAADAKKATSKA